jgi:cobalamin biosynthesis protein CobW
MEGEEQHDHDDFISFTVALPDVKDRGTLQKRIAEVIANSTILRLKGFANVVGSSSRLLIQAVGPRMNSYFDRPWKSGENRATRLVVIGVKGMDQQAITAALQG